MWSSIRFICFEVEGLNGSGREWIAHQHSKAKGLGGADPLRSGFLKGDAISDGEKTYKFRCRMESGLAFFKEGLSWSRNGACFFSFKGKASYLTFSAKPVEEVLALG